MNSVRIGFVAVALLVSASVAEGQWRVAARDVPPGQRPPRGMCRIWIDGVPPGRQPRPTSCGIAEANAPTNSRIIYGDNTPFPGRGRGRVARECTFQRTSTIAGVIFGRRDANVECRPTGRRELGAWYEIGRDRSGNRIYQRRVRLADGTIVLQRARRGRNGSLAVFDSRYPGSAVDRDTDDDDRRWANASRQRPQPAQQRGRGNSRGRGRGNQ
jgi:hypothetical protein